MKTILLFLTFGVTFLPQSHSADVSWDQEFLFEAPPAELHPGWKSLGNPAEEIKDGTLEIQSATDGGSYWLFEGDPESWDAEEPTTVEFRARVANVDDGAKAGAEIDIKNNNFMFIFYLTNTEFKTFRIVLDHNQAAVYDMESPGSPQIIEGLRLERDIHPDSVLHPNSIGFGDYSSEIGGSSQWKFLRWTNKGAFNP